MTDTFEVHLIVKPENEPALFAYCLDLDAKKQAQLKIHMPKPSRAVSFYGDCPQQPMLTFWVDGSEKDAIEIAQAVALEMKKQKMVVLRLKVELMTINSFVRALKPTDLKENQYFEFHFKVAIESKKQWDQVAQICLPFGAHLFFNAYSKNSGLMTPVVTLRRYHTDFKTADTENCKLIEAIVAAGFIEPEKVHKELSVVDSNVWLDRGWLFADKPQEFITNAKTFHLE